MCPGRRLEEEEASDEPLKDPLEDLENLSEKKVDQANIWKDLDVKTELPSK